MKFSYEVTEISAQEDKFSKDVIRRAEDKTRMKVLQSVSSPVARVVWAQVNQTIFEALDG